MSREHRIPYIKYIWLVTFIIFFILVPSFYYWNVSIGTYYDSKEKEKLRESSVLSKGIEVILLQPVREQEKKHLLAAYLDNQVSAHFTVINTSNGEIYYKNDSYTFIDKTRSKIERRATFVSDNNKYDFVYEYYNKPRFWDAIIRAWTWSLGDIFSQYRVSGDIQRGIDLWLKYDLYKRSIHLWFIAISLFGCSFIAIKYWEKSRKLEIIDRQRERQFLEHQVKSQEVAARLEKARAEAMEELARAKEVELSNIERFKLMYNKMCSDVRKKSIEDPKQELTDLELSWKDQMEKVMSAERHDLVNKLGENYWDDYERKLYERVVYRCVEKILNHLRGTVEKMEISLKRYSVKDIHKALLKAQPDGFKRAEWLEFHYGDLPSTLKENMVCEINIKRLESVMFNLLDNSSRAIQVYRNNLRKSGISREELKKHKGLIEVEFFLKQINGIENLCIQVSDNGGGFPDGVLKDVYIKNVQSSKGNRLGEGTAYISFFIQLMNGRVEATNYLVDLDTKGARTKVYLPTLS